MLCNTMIRGMKCVNHPLKRLYLCNKVAITRSLASTSVSNNDIIKPNGVTNDLNQLKPFSTTTEPKIDEKTTIKTGFESRNILTSTFRSKHIPYTPGQAFFVLMKKGSKGNPIRHKEFYGLCEATCQGKPSHSKRIYSALKWFRGVCKFKLTPELARVAVQNMMKGIISNEENKNKNKDIVGKEMVRAALFVCDAFMDQYTGLFFTLSSKDFNTLVLFPMLHGLQQSNYYSKQHESRNEEEYEAHLKSTYHTLRKTIKTFIRRATVRQYTSPAAYRKFTKRLNLGGDLGPSGHTLHTATRICNYISTVTNDTHANYSAERGFIYHFRKYLNRDVSFRTKRLLQKPLVVHHKEVEVLEGNHSSEDDSSDNTSKDETNQEK